MKKILMVRNASVVCGDLSEISSGNSASLDHFLFKYLTMLGYHIDVIQPSVKFRKCLEENKVPFYEKIHIIDGVPTDDVLNSEYEFLFIQQGCGNLNFTGERGVSSAIVSHRLLRNCKIPAFYVQYDANTPFLLPSSRAGGDLMNYIGVTAEELKTLNFNVLSVGQNPLYYKNMKDYSESFDYVHFHFWKRDLHSISFEFMKQFAKPINENPENKISFIGKDRNKGSKGGMLLGVAKALQERNLSYFVNVIGKWENFVENNKDVIPQEHMKFNKQVFGLDNVLNEYNKSKFALLPHNKFNLELQQYTIRTFEVIGGGAIPIMHRDFLEIHRCILSETMYEKLKKLSFNDELEIPEIIENFDKEYSNNDRIAFIEELRRDVLSHINEEYVLSELKNTLNESNNFYKNRKLEKVEINFDDMLNNSIVKRMELTDEEKIQMLKRG